MRMANKYDFVPLEREDEYGPFRLMAVAEGYVMARRKGAMPFVVPVDEWVEIGRGKQPIAALKPVPEY
jgi:hypothetical protein